MNPTRTRSDLVRLGILLLCAFLTSLSSFGHTIRLAWNSNPEPNIAGYKLYAGTSESGFTEVTDVGLITETDIEVPTEGLRFYYAVSAYNTLGIESSYSTPLAYDCPTSSGNRAPVVKPISVTTLEDAAVTIKVVGTDPESHPITWSLDSLPRYGVLVGSLPNLTYVPDADYYGSDSFDVIASDGEATCSPVTVTVTIVAQNDPPVVAPFPTSTLEDSAVKITLTAQDPDGPAPAFFVVQGPANGTLSGTAPNLTYTPKANFFGTDTFTYRASDGFLTSSTATVQISVTPMNDAPTAIGTSLTTAYQTSTVLTLAGTDLEGTPLKFTITQAPANGTLSGIAPNLTYSPKSGFSGTDTVKFTVSDGSLTSATATVTIIVSGTTANKGPVAYTSSVTLNANESKPVGIVASDPNKDPLTYTLVRAPAYGTLSGSLPNVVYTPRLNYTGSDSFRFSVTDPYGASDAASVSLTIVAGNNTPVPVATSLVVKDGAALSFVLAATDADGDPITFTLVTRPTHGALIGTPPNLTFAPEEDYSGPDFFTFTVSDGKSTSAPATVSISITAPPTNQRPVALASTINGREDSPLAAQVGGTDPESKTLSYTVTTQPKNGTLSGTAPNFLYTPKSNFNGTDSFKFTVSDGELTSVEATVSIQITPENDVPQVTSSEFRTSEDKALTLTVETSDIDGDTVSVTVVEAPLNGSLSGTAPNLTYTPNSNFSGTDTIKVRANDGTVDSPITTLTLVVTPENDTPKAGALALKGTEDISLGLALPGSDVDGDSLGYTIIKAPQYGTLSGTAPNLTYTPKANWSGSDTFEYQVTDGKLTSDTAVVSITVAAVNDSPSIVSLAISTTEDNAVSITLQSQDPDGPDATLSVVQVPANGTLSGTFPNLVYTPKANFFGTDTFTYTATDGSLTSSTETVTITVLPVNDAPVAVSATVPVTFQTATPLTLGGSDLETPAPLFTITQGPVNGTLSGTAPNLTYTPKTGFGGPDQIRFTVSDGELTSDVATITIYVSGNPLNKAPIAYTSSLTLAANTPKSFTLTASDPDSDPITYVILQAPTRGTLTGTLPNVVYTPAPGYSGSDTVRFSATDPYGATDSASVSLTIVTGNLTPVALASSVSGQEDTALAVRVSGSDPENSALTFAVTEAPKYGTLSGTGPNFTYTPKTDFNGTDSFKVTASDGVLTSEPASIVIQIAAVNDAPKAIAMSVEGTEDMALNLSLIGSDVERDSLGFTVTVPPKFGILSGTPPNLTYTPVTNRNGLDSFRFTVNDGKLTSTEAVVTLSLAAVNDPPTANPRSITLNEDGSMVLTLTGSDADREGLYFVITQYPTNGTLIGTLPNMRYTPKANFSGTDRFLFTVADRVVTSEPAEISISVTAVNDAPVANAATFAVTKNTAKSITVTGSDVDSTGLTYKVYAAPRYGTLSGTAPNFTYTPSANYTGTDSFQFTASDGKLTSAPATITLNVKTASSTGTSELAANTLTVAPDVAIVLANGSTTNLLGGQFSVLTNDVAPLGDSLSATLISPPTSGAMIFKPDGTFEYTHDGASNLIETATYQATASSGPSLTGTLSIHVFRVLGGETGESGTDLEFSVVNGLGYSVEILDGTPEPTSTWQTLASFVGKLTGIATVTDTSPSGSVDRYYRVRCTSGPSSLVTEPWVRPALDLVTLPAAQ